MTMQAATLSERAATLREQFHARFGVRLNARVGAGSLRGCLVLAVPALRTAETVDRSKLRDFGAWLESLGFYYAHDHARAGHLSAPNAWTCWNGGVSVSVCYRR